MTRLVFAVRFHRMDTLRRLCALHLLAFFVAASVVPHRHSNSLEDLLSDGRSDSGVFLEASEPHDSTAGAQWSGARFRDDDPCLACFQHDFDSATEIIEIFTLDPKFSYLWLSWPLHVLTILATPVRDLCSRSPPALS
jgi:hypothetical protein